MLPWNVTTVGDKVYVSYAAIGADENNPAVPSTGEEDHAAREGRGAEFTGDGDLIKVLDERGSLDAPWWLSPPPASASSPATCSW